MKKWLVVVVFISTIGRSMIHAQNVFVWDGHTNNLSGPVWTNYLIAQGFTVTYPPPGSPLPADYSQYDAIFLNFGIYPTNYALSIQDASAIKNYVYSGGKLYIEGGDIFGWISGNPGATIIQQICGLSGADDGSGMTMPLSGVNGTLTNGMIFTNYTGGNSYIDILYPATSTSIFTTDGVSRGIEWNNPIYQYRVVGMTFEIGGLEDGINPNTKSELMFRIVSFLLPPTYTPRALTATAGINQVTLQWAKPVLQNNFLKYRIYYGTTTKPTTLMDSTTVGNINDTTKTITGLQNGVWYYFRVTTVHTGGESNFSNEAKARPFNPPVGIIVTTISDGGPGSLRWAIDSANSTSKKDTISFAPGLIGSTIILNDSLPTLRFPVHLNGDITDDGIPDIELESSALDNKNILTLTSGGSVIRGLIFKGYRSVAGSGGGILIEGSQAQNNRIIGNYFGYRDPQSPVYYNTYGIKIMNASYNMIGGNQPEEGNIFISMAGDNLFLSNSHYNRITGNYFGTDPQGTILTQGAGYNIHLVQSHLNRIGGDITGTSNYVCGSLYHGIYLDESHRNTILGNRIGLTPGGGLHPNGNDGNKGIFINNSSFSNAIGNLTALGRNLIVGHTVGIAIENNSDSTKIMGNIIGYYQNDYGNQTGIFLNAVKNTLIGDGSFMGRNIISQNNNSGILLQNTSQTQIIHNYIGTDTTGQSGAQSYQNGIEIFDDCKTILIQQNVISGNNNGIYLNNSDFPIRDIKIKWNLIGTDYTGTQAIGNFNNGIFAIGSGLIIKMDSIAFNRISHNQYGIYFSGTGVDSTLIFANSITQNYNKGIFYYDNPQGNIPPPTLLSYSNNFLNGSGGRFGGYVQVYADFEDEGEFFIGTTLPDVNGSWSIPIPANLPYNINLTALNTDIGNRTSVFANPLMINQNHLVVTKTSDLDTIGTLRHAINYATMNPGPDTIRFNMPKYSRIITSGFILSADSIVINGDMDNDGLPDIQISTTPYLQNPAAFRIDGSHNVIKGLIINDCMDYYYNGTGIYITGAYNTVMSCFIGTDSTGNAARPNGTGIFVVNAGQDNRIGDSTVTGRNVISGNSTGIMVYNTSQLQILGNFIGLNAAGNAALTGQKYGIRMSYSNNNYIGSGPSTARNIISGNLYSGVLLNNSHLNTIINNWIGLAANGLQPIPNNVGIELVNNCDGNKIGNGSANGRNVISGNGVNILFHNQISLLEKSTNQEKEKRSDLKGTNSIENNLIIGNFIGTTREGNAPVGGISEETGILFHQVYEFPTIGSNQIGGASDDSANVIGGCRDAIVFVDSDLNRVINNRIGISLDLSTPLPNEYNGIVLTESNSDTFGSLNNVFTNNYITHNDSTAILAIGSYTRDNIFSVNRFYNNNQLIRFMNGAQLNLTPPQITGLTVNDILSGSAEPYADIYLYADFAPNPQGRFYLGHTTANASGMWQFPVTGRNPSWLFRALQQVNQNTSPFSNAYLPPVFPVLVVTPDTLNFGDVYVGQTLIRSLTLKALNNTVMISSITLQAPGFFISGNLSFPFSIPVGDSLTLNIQFAPPFHGLFSGYLNIENNSTQPTIEIPMTGKGIPGSLVVIPGQLSFSPTPLNDSTELIVALTALNGGVQINNIADMNIPEFEYFIPDLPTTVLPGDTLYLQAKFKPTQYGYYCDTLHVLINSATVTVKIPVYGETVFNQLATNINPLVFPSTLIGQTSYQNLILRASGGTVTVSSLVTGNQNSPFNSTFSDLPRTLNIGDSLIIPFSFTPSENTLFIDTTYIYHNGFQNPFKVVLQGQGFNNLPPHPFALKPVGANNLTNSRIPVFAWESKGDPDSDALTYILEVSKQSNFSVLAYRDTTADTTLTSKVMLDSVGSYYWRVTAHDGWGGSRTSNTGYFRIDAVPASLTAGTFFSSVLKQYISVNVISTKLMRSLNASIGLRSAANALVDSTTKAFDLESAANRFYQTPYKLTSAGRLFLTITGTDSAGNISTVLRNYSVAELSKHRPMMLVSSDGNWHISAPKGTFAEEGYLMVSASPEKAYLLKGSSLQKMADMTTGWMAIGPALELKGSSAIREGEGFLLTMYYSKEALAELEIRYGDFDERKIGIYAESNGQWVYLGGEGKNAQVQVKVKQYGTVKLMYNPDHEFLPTKLELAQNYPNPFNPTTTIRFGIPQEGKVKLTIYNVLGQKVTELVNDSRNAGYYNVIWNGRNERGTVVSSGVYLYKLETAEGVVVKKMILVK